VYFNSLPSQGWRSSVPSRPRERGETRRPRHRQRPLRHPPAGEQLRNAVNDARTVGAALKDVGFDAIAGENLGRSALVDRFGDLLQRLGPGDTAFFFSGHGVALDGVNYILPVTLY
jgi:hypothetical protein